jgi:hypothetical protein
MEKAKPPQPERRVLGNLGVGSSLRSSEQTPGPIDWDSWRHMADAMLYEAVALSLNINPESVVLSKPGEKSLNNPEFETRLKIAISHNRSDLGRFGHEQHRVSLPGFCAWAMGIWDDLPEEMKVLGKQQARTRETASASKQPTLTAENEIKKAALILKHKRNWPTIERDLKDAWQNNLSEMAKLPRHGFWNENLALQWAKTQGKYTVENQMPPQNSMFNLGGTTHTMQG